MRIQRLFERIRKGKVQNVDFEPFSTLVGELGFHFERVSAGHWVFLHPAVPRPFPMKPKNWLVRPYQVQQLVRMVEIYNLGAAA